MKHLKQKGHYTQNEEKKTYLKHYRWKPEKIVVYFLNIFFKNKHSQKQEKKNETKMQMDDLNIR